MEARPHPRSGRGRRLTSVVLIATVMLAAAALAACGDGALRAADELPSIDRGPDTTIVIPAGEPLVVGVSTALTGPVGHRGEEYLDAVITGVERWRAANGDSIHGHPIVVVAEDDACAAPGVAAAAADRLLRQPGLLGVLGPQCSDGVEGSLDLYVDAGVPAISGSATKTGLTAGDGDPFFFRTAHRNDFEGILIATFVAFQLQADSLYLIDDGGSFGIDLADTAAFVLGGTGVDVTRLSAPFGTVDFTDIVQAAEADRPDAVGYTGFNPDASLLYRQLRDAGYDGVFGAGNAAASQDDFVEPVGEQAENVLFAGCRYPLADDVEDAFRRVHGGPTSATFSGHYIDAVTVLLDAVAAVATPSGEGLVIEPRELRDAIASTYLTDGVTGRIAFDSRGDRVPEPGLEADDVVAAALADDEGDVLTSVGLIPCQAQDGRLVPLAGPGAAEIRLPAGLGAP
jgi:branched-chain amino acid transport system substrate-binding protein